MDQGAIQRATRSTEITARALPIGGTLWIPCPARNFWCAISHRRPTENRPRQAPPRTIAPTPFPRLFEINPKNHKTPRSPTAHAMPSPKPIQDTIEFPKTPARGNNPAKRPRPPAIITHFVSAPTRLRYAVETSGVAASQRSPLAKRYASASSLRKTRPIQKYASAPVALTTAVACSGYLFSEYFIPAPRTIARRLEAKKMAEAHNKHIGTVTPPAGSGGGVSVTAGVSDILRICW
mmetsp:Transcript_54077/g.105814  ORF Transcript_54077/g.105814 Transcript_54077/m.105814 type:complete len:236 (+) Transcript_54077:388-1095(+)